MTNMQFPATVNEFLMVKAKACEVLLQFHRDAGELPEPLDGADRALFINLTVSRMRQVKNAGQKYACKLLMDVYTPNWGIEEPRLFARFAGRYVTGYGKWRDSVLRRDHYQCRACQSDSNLHAHHIIPWRQSVIHWLDVDNGVTLCQGCHRAQHRDMSRKIWE